MILHASRQLSATICPRFVLEQFRVLSYVHCSDGANGPNVQKARAYFPFPPNVSNAGRRHRRFKYRIMYSVRRRRGAGSHTCGGGGTPSERGEGAPSVRPSDVGEKMGASLGTHAAAAARVSERGAGGPAAAAGN